MKTKMKLEDKIGLAVLIVGISFILIYPYYKWKTHEKARYTIGLLKDISPTRGAYVPIFTYSIQDRVIEARGQYQTIVTPLNKKKHLLRRYYVTFYENRPSKGRMLLDYPVPDSIITAPPFGWDSIPGVGELEIPFVWDGGKSPPIKKK